MISTKQSASSMARRIFFGVLIAFGGYPITVTLASDSPVLLSVMTDAERDFLEKTLEEAANVAANKRAFFEPDMRPIFIRAFLDVTENKLIFDMEERFGPEAGYTWMTDLASTVEEVIAPSLTGVEKLSEIEWRYGGKTIDYWMPDEQTSESVKVSRNERAQGTAPVLVAAGHGAYYHHGFKSWTTHRAEKYGIIEDNITPKLAAELVNYLKLNQFHAAEVRSSSAFTTHEPSGKPFWEVGARYHLQAAMPDVPSIWHSLPDSVAPNREAKEDIKSRPLYANHVGAPAIFHLHTNAVDPPGDISTRGARAYVFTGQTESARLAKLALCSMRELIHSVDRFHDFPVAVEPHSSTKHAETKLANMPAVIIETAFHTHPEDAQLLKDPEFRKLAMMGVAKGYKLFNEGATCAPFVLADHEPFDVPVGEQVSMPVALSGNPYYPVDVRYTPSRCLREPCKTKGKLLFSAQQVEAFGITYSCGRNDVAEGPIDYEVFAKDSYGVMTNRVHYRLTCKNRHR